MDLPVAASSGFAHGRPGLPLGGVAHGPANHGHKYSPGAKKKTTTHDDEKMLSAHTGKAGDAGRWGTATLGLRPGNGMSVLFLPCERGSHSHTVVVARPRLSLAL